MNQGLKLGATAAIAFLLVSAGSVEASTEYNCEDEFTDTKTTAVTHKSIGQIIKVPAGKIYRVLVYLNN